MDDALQVARFMLKLAAGEAEAEYLSHMRLQKLLYYAQAWSLTFRDEPLFASPIEAWVHGPVVRDVYPHFADYGDSPIAFHEAADSHDIDADARALIESIWRAYRRYSATQLRRMTHRERPWLEARAGRRSTEPGDAEITLESMKTYFAEAYERRNRFRGLDLQSVRRARAQFNAGVRGIRLEDAMKKLRDAV